MRRLHTYTYEGATCRFFHDAGAVSDSAARSLAARVGAPVTMWPTSSHGAYRTTWFDAVSDTYQECEVVIQ